MSLTSHIVRTLFTIGDLKRDLGWKKPRNVDSVENISYAEDDKWHLLDVYRPRKATGPFLSLSIFMEELGFMEIKRFMLPIVCI